MTRSQLYKFQFRPISTIDDLMLVALYVAMLVYVVLNLRETPRSVKSPLGLILTILIEVYSSPCHAIQYLTYLDDRVSHCKLYYLCHLGN